MPLAHFLERLNINKITPIGEVLGLYKVVDSYKFNKILQALIVDVAAVWRGSNLVLHTLYSSDKTYNGLIKFIKLLYFNKDAICSSTLQANTLCW